MAIEPKMNETLKEKNFEYSFTYNKENEKIDIEEEVPLSDEPKNFKDWFRFYGFVNRYEKNKRRNQAEKCRRILFLIFSIILIVSGIIAILLLVFDKFEKKNEGNQ